MTRVVQAAGRLLRSEDDRGTIILMGRRFLDGRYYRMLPDEWTHQDPEALSFEDPVEAIREFFGE
jgi:Rad3-related DNA helicase